MNDEAPPVVKVFKVLLRRGLAQLVGCRQKPQFFLATLDRSYFGYLTCAGYYIYYMLLKHTYLGPRGATDGLSSVLRASVTCNVLPVRELSVLRNSFLTLLKKEV
jgi:hypothetical protein